MGSKFLCYECGGLGTLKITSNNTKLEFYDSYDNPNIVDWEEYESAIVHIARPDCIDPMYVDIPEFEIRRLLFAGEREVERFLRGKFMEMGYQEEDINDYEYKRMAQLFLSDAKVYTLLKGMPDRDILICRKCGQIIIESTITGKMTQQVRAWDGEENVSIHEKEKIVVRHMGLMGDPIECEIDTDEIGYVGLYGAVWEILEGYDRAKDVVKYSFKEPYRGDDLDRMVQRFIADLSVLIGHNLAKEIGLDANIFER